MNGWTTKTYNDNTWANVNEFDVDKNIRLEPKRHTTVKNKIESFNQWMTLTNSKNFPRDIPTKPHNTYKNKGWIKAITDNGAGGLSSSLGELARISNGIIVDTAKVPLKYQLGLILMPIIESYHLNYQHLLNTDYNQWKKY